MRALLSPADQQTYQAEASSVTHPCRKDITHHHSDESRAAGAERQSHAHFVHALRDGRVKNAVDAESGQGHGEGVDASEQGSKQRGGIRPR
jgi:hypothetical protein